jgi:hypothetical protein
MLTNLSYNTTVVGFYDHPGFIANSSDGACELSHLIFKSLDWWSNNHGDPQFDIYLRISNKDFFSTNGATFPNFKTFEDYSFASFNLSDYKVWCQSDYREKSYFNLLSKEYGLYSYITWLWGPLESLANFDLTSVVVVIRLKDADDLETHSSFVSLDMLAYGYASSYLTQNKKVLSTQK